MSSWARPGVKCVCIDNTHHPQLKLGHVYTIVAVEADDPSVRQAGVYAGSRTLIELAEVKNWSVKPSYAVERFRPLITRTQEQDVAIFTPLLTATPVREQV